MNAAPAHNDLVATAAALQTAYEGHRKAHRSAFEALRAGGAFRAPFGGGLAGRQAGLGLAEPLRPAADADEAG